MKTEKTHEEAAAPTPKGGATIKTLKLTKETTATLSHEESGAVKGGANFTRAGGVVSVNL